MKPETTTYQGRTVYIIEANPNECMTKISDKPYPRLDRHGSTQNVFNSQLGN